MEHPPRRDPDDEPLGPEDEQMEPGIIDMTGAVEQDDAIGDVIYDAIGEAEEGDGIVPEWGARTLARALANERDDPITGALHHYAVTGRVDREQILGELAEFTTGPHDEETRTWAGWLEAYVHNLPAEAEQQAPAGPDADPLPGEATADEEPDPDDEIIFGGSAVAKVNHYLQATFAEAKARGEVISRDDARIIATMLAPVLGHESAMIRFAETDEFDRTKLQEECAYFKARTQPTSDVGTWIQHLEQYLESQPTDSALLPPQEAETPDNPLITRGIEEHGDAFRAYLKLPDVDPQQPDLLEKFPGSYVGSFDSIADVVEGLTELRESTATIEEAVARTDYADHIDIVVDWSSLEAHVRAAWDIIEHGSKLHVFSK